MSNNKQSSIEWLVEQLETNYVKHDLRNTTVFDQAKAMHREEIEEAYWEGGQWVPTVQSSCTTYYNETFNTEAE